MSQTVDFVFSKREKQKVVVSAITPQRFIIKNTASPPPEGDAEPPLMPSRAFSVYGYSHANRGENEPIIKIDLRPGMATFIEAHFATVQKADEDEEEQVPDEFVGALTFFEQ